MSKSHLFEASEYVARAKTTHWSLPEVTDRLANHELVTGLLQIGSLASRALTSASDYDLVIVLQDTPRLWYVGVTQIDRRFTDLIFVTASTVERICALETPTQFDDELAPIIRWITSGHILFDHTGQLRQAQKKMQQREWVQPIDDQEAYGAWFAINFNLAHAQRMIRAQDPLYRTTVQIRMAVYGHMDLWFGYFKIRKVVGKGDKAAVSYLLQQDKAFLECTSSLLQK